MNCYWKWYNRWLRLYYPCYCPGQIYIARGPWHFVDFHYIFRPTISEDQKKFYHLSAGLQELCHMVNPALVIAVHSKKVRWGPEVVTITIKSLNFTWVIHLDCLEKLNWGCPGHLVVNIIYFLFYCCTQKMLKVTEIEETIGIFIIGGISIEGVLATPMALGLFRPVYSFSFTLSLQPMYSFLH